MEKNGLRAELVRISMLLIFARKCANFATKKIADGDGHAII
jgi:hypothetical protein